MRKISVLFFFLFLSLLLFSCSKYESQLENNDINESENVINSAKTVNDENLDYFPFKLPEGTVIIEKENEISFELPEGYLAYGIDSNNNYTSFTKGSVTCNCTGGKSGCSPGKIGDTVACVMTTCGSCTKSGSAYFDSTMFSEIGIFKIDEPMAFFNKPTDLNDKIMLPPQFYDLDIIENQLIELKNNLLPAETTETKIVPISLYGYVVLIEVAKNVDTTSPYMITSSVKCGCNTSGSCPKDSKLIAVWCDASNCKSCTMTTSIFDSISMQEYTFEANYHSISVY